MGGRLHAGLACLMKSNTNTNTNRSVGDKSLLLLRQCQDLCDRQFMSLEPIPEALFALAASAAAAATPDVPNSCSGK